MFDFSAVKRSVQGLEARMGSLRTEMADLQNKRQATHLAPAAREDVKALVVGWVRGGGGAHAATIQETIELMSRNPQAMATYQDRVKQLVSFGAAASAHAGDVDQREIGRALCFVFGKQIEDAVTRAIDAMEWPANALSQAKRSEEVAALDARILALETEQNEIINKAQEIGLRLNLE